MAETLIYSEGRDKRLDETKLRRLNKLGWWIGLAGLLLMCPMVWAEVRGVDFGLGAPDSPLYERFGELAGAQSGQGQNSDESQQKPDSDQPNSLQAASQARDDANKSVPVSKQQPKRILGLMPNYRAVSAGAIPPPPTPKEAFVIATRNSFDYSSFVFVGITSAMAEWSDAHKQLGEGFEGYGRYYWRGYLDKTIGNYMVIFTLPTVLHEDERYYAKGEGGILKRAVYAATRVLITPNYDGKNTLNISELLGRASAQAISVSYYPSQDRTAGSISEKYAYAIGRDALTNVFREFWPDIATHILHRHP